MTMNRKYWILISVVVFLIVISFVLYINYIWITPTPAGAPRHMFKVKEIYPTKPVAGNGLWR